MTFEGVKRLGLAWPFKAYRIMHFSLRIQGIDQTNLVYTFSNNNQGRDYHSYQFHVPSGRGSSSRAWLYTSYIKNPLFFFKSPSLHLGIDQTN